MKHRTMSWMRTMALSPVCCFTCFFSDENCRIIITVAGELPCVFRQLALLAATDADNIETPIYFALDFLVVLFQLFPFFFAVFSQVL